MGIAYLEKYGLALNQRVTPVKGPSYQNTNSNVLNMSKLLSLYIAVTVTGLTAIAAVCWLLLVS